MSEVWAKWEGQVIDGVFPLRRYLGGSEHSGVFLTAHGGRGLPNAALKLVPAIPTLWATQLAHWRAATALSHPHLIQLFESGHCQLGGLEFLFVVMDYADQTLSQILAQRALTPDEVRDMLPPALAALGFLHGRLLVQGHLTPTSILVVGDQLKLASDTIRPAGDSSATIAPPSMYDPPESSDGGFSVAGDAWSLGVTLVEALTQRPPVWSETGFDATCLPAGVPTAITSLVRQCLDRDPGGRPTMAELAAQLAPAAVPPPNPPPPPNPVSPPAPVSPPNPVSPTPTRPPARAVSAAPVASSAPRRAAPAEATPKWRARAARPAIMLAATIVILLGVWAGLRSTNAPRIPEPPAAAPPAAATPNATPVANSQPENDASSVLHQEIPEVSRNARGTIRGRIEILVRVTVDRSGGVSSAVLENPGPSRYFARLAVEAARKWKFAPADNQDPRRWVLRFEFSRAGVSAHVAAARPS